MAILIIIYIHVPINRQLLLYDLIKICFVMHYFVSILVLQSS